MKLLLAVLTFATSLLSIQCRPQAVQIEQQVLRLLPDGRSLEPLLGNQRGSTEETDRILREIERINVAMGYKKKQDVAFPRADQGFDGAGYFYPRPAYFPPSLVQLKAAAAGPLQKTPKGIVAHPFRAQSFFYPAPYLQLPTMASPRAFQFVPVPVAFGQPPVAQFVRSAKQLRQSDPIYILPISVPAADGKSSEIRYIPSTINFGSWGAVQFRGKSLDLDRLAAPTRGVKRPKGVMDEVAEVADAVQSTKLEEELLDEIAEAVDYDEDEDERKGAEAAGEGEPALANDKFMGGPTKESAETDEDDSEPDVEMVMLQKVAGKSFNISNVFNNFTHRFSILSTTLSTTELSPSEPGDAGQDLKDLKEKPLTGDEDLPAQDKGPFGIFGTKQADAGSGLVIQRLRVRHGGIAIAGPGGVATAGSGGTAIVGPNGTAITHPRSLTIAGPGAKIYAVPETVDLANTINATKRSLPLDAVLVASGPVVYYRT